MFEQEIKVYQNYNKVMKTYLTNKKKSFYVINYLL